MIRIVVTMFSVLVTVLIIACGVDQRTTSRLTTTANAASADTSVTELEEVEKGFAGIQIRRGNLSRGWAAEVRRGDVRDHRSLATDLGEMKILLKKLEGLPVADTSSLQSKIRAAMIEDCRLLLWVARTGKDIWALEDFLRHVQDLDVSPEEDFGVKPSQLRTEALAMAKQAIAELRPRARDGSGDAVGSIRMVLLEWQFTPAELGLTAEDIKSLSGNR